MPDPILARSLADPTILEILYWVSHILWVDVKVVIVGGALIFAFCLIIGVVGMGVKAGIDALADYMERRGTGEQAQRDIDEEVTVGFGENVWEGAGLEEGEEIADGRDMRGDGGYETPKVEA